MSIDIALQDADNASLPTGLEGVVKENNDILEEALKKALNRESSDGPNFMLVDLDMNGFRILNLGRPTSPTDLVRLQDVSVIKAGEFRRNPDTGDLEYKIDGYDNWQILYTFAELKGEQGDPGIDGTGIGDLVSTNNLSDVSNPATALANLGGEPTIPPNTYAPFDDSRFEQYDIVGITDGATTVTDWGKLFFKFGTGTGTLTLTAGLDGCVNTVANNRASGDLTIEMAAGGPTLYIAGETGTRPIVLAPGGMATIIQLNSSNAIVSGAGIRVA